MKYFIFNFCYHVDLVNHAIIFMIKPIQYMYLFVFNSNIYAVLAKTVAL